MNLKRSMYIFSLFNADFLFVTGLPFAGLFLKLTAAVGPLTEINHILWHRLSLSGLQTTQRGSDSKAKKACTKCKRN